MKPERGLLVAGGALAVCCAAPVLAGSAVLAGFAGFVCGAWWLFAVAAVLCALILIGVYRRSITSRKEV